MRTYTVTQTQRSSEIGAGSEGGSERVHEGLAYPRMFKYVRPMGELMSAITQTEPVQVDGHHGRDMALPAKGNHASLGTSTHRACHVQMRAGQATALRVHA